MEGNALSVMKELVDGPGQLQAAIQAALREYYLLWDTRILNALTRSTPISLLQLQVLIASPQFEVVTQLATPKLHYQPISEGIGKTFATRSR
jgi:hypothetical protein